MTVQELLIQISSIASIEGEKIAEANIFTDNSEIISRVLDIRYSEVGNQIIFNIVEVSEDEEE